MLEHSGRRSDRGEDYGGIMAMFPGVFRAGSVSQEILPDRTAHALHLGFHVIYAPEDDAVGPAINQCQEVTGELDALPPGTSWVVWR